MTITQIKQIAKSCRYNIYVDGSFYGIFLDETLALWKLKTGQEIEEDDLKRIKFENDQKLSFDMAMSYIEKYSVCEKGARDYLKKKNFDHKTIECAVEKLKGYGYVDDEKFAKNYFDSLSSGHGKRAIAAKLLQKGVSKKIVEDLMENVDEEAQTLLAKKEAKKFAKNRENSPKTYQKCLAHLIYKGYDYSVAKKATDSVLSGVIDFF